jgi:hypothetical protein
MLLLGFSLACISALCLPHAWYVCVCVSETVCARVGGGVLATDGCSLRGKKGPGFATVQSVPVSAILHARYSTGVRMHVVPTSTGELQLSHAIVQVCVCVCVCWPKLKLTPATNL